MVLALSISSFWVFILPRFSSPISPLFLAYAVVIQPANTLTILPGSTEKLKAQSNIVRFSNHARRKGPLEMSSSRGERFAPTFRLFPRGSVTAAMAVARHGFDIPESCQDLFLTTETQRTQRMTLDKASGEKKTGCLPLPARQRVLLCALCVSAVNGYGAGCHPRYGGIQKVQGGNG